MNLDRENVKILMYLVLGLLIVLVGVPNAVYALRFIDDEGWTPGRQPLLDWGYWNSYTTVWLWYFYAMLAVIAVIVIAVVSFLIQDRMGNTQTDQLV